MKRVFSILMTVVMILSMFTGLSPRIYAADGEPEVQVEEPAAVPEEPAQEPGSEDPDASGEVQEGDNGFYASADQDYVYYYTDDHPTLRVIAYADEGALTYQWSTDEGPIDGAVTSEYTVESVSKRFTNFYCQVEDEYGHSEQVVFQVVYNYQFYITECIPFSQCIVAESGSTAEIGVYAYVEIGGIRYQWSVKDTSTGEFVPISGATSNFYTVNVANVEQVYRITLKDDSDFEFHEDFYVFPTSCAIELNLDETRSFEVSPAGKLFAFTSAETGEYDVLGNTPNSVSYVLGRFEGGSFNCYESGGFSSSFNTRTYISSGVTCYVVLRSNSYEDSATGDITFKKHNYNGFYVRAKNDENTFSVAPGASVVLEVEAGADSGEITYRWYDSNWNEISGATEPTYTVNNIQKYTEYYCEVSDEYGNRNGVWFYIRIDNGFYARAKNDEDTITVAPGSRVVLEVEAGTTSGGITYQWYDSNGNEISGATNSSYIVDSVAKTEEYTCVVMDDYGYSISIRFYIRIDNGFYARAKNDENTILVAPGKNAVMEVEAGANSGTISYQWYYDYREIEGAVSSSYSIDSVEKYAEYYCHVSDEFGNYENVWFYIRLDNHLHAYVAGTTETDQYLTVSPGEDLSFAVDVTADDITGIRYQWHKTYPTEYDNDEWREIKDATSSSYSETAVDRRFDARCDVTDQYGNWAYVYFHVNVDNGFSARAKDNEDTIKVDFGGSAVMEVEAEANSGNVYYQWYYGKVVNDAGGGWHTEWSKIDGATGAAYTVESINAHTEYKCYVQDEYGNSQYVWFYIYIDSGLEARAKNDTVKVAPGGTALLEVEASVNAGTISYKWYQVESGYDANGEWYYHEIEIQNGASSSCSVGPVERTADYYCRVSDDFGNSLNVGFRVQIDNGFYAQAKNDEHDILVVSGGNAVMEVEAGVNSGTISYQWYQVESGYDANGEWYRHETEIQNAVSPSYSIGPVEESAEYYCHVSDEYGNSENVWFNIRLENNLHAYVAGTTETYQYITVPPGEELTFAVDVAADDMTGISYQWYRTYLNENGYDEWREIKGATASSYSESAIDRSFDARCYVADQYGNWVEVYFYVRIDNGFEARPKNNESTVWTDLGGSAVMEVEAKVNSGKIYYQWYGEVGVDEEGGGWHTEMRKIDGATAATYTAGPINAQIQYYCEVKDDYGNSQHIWFNIHINNGLYARAKNDQNSLTVAPGGSALMEVEAGANNGTVSYKWYRVERGYDEDGQWYYREVEIIGATGASCSTGSVNESTDFYCYVSDEYGNAINVWFYIRIDNGFYARPVGDEYGYGTKEIKVTPGGSASMEVEAGANSGEIHYQWYEFVRSEDGYYTEEIIEGATESVYIVDSVNNYKQFYCRVQDDYGNSANVWFNIYVDNEFKAYAKGMGSTYAEYTVEPGGTKELAVEASVKTGTITYQWASAKRISQGNGWYYGDEKEISGATAASYTTAPITDASTDYVCHVCDEYGNSENIWFHFVIDNGMYAYVSGTTGTYKRIRIAPEEDVLLEVDAGTNDPKEVLSYQWFESNMDSAISGAVSSSYKVKKVAQNAYYYCKVTDKYNNTKTVTFYVYIDSGLTAHPKDYNHTVAVQANASTELEVIATVKKGSIRYQWYKYDDSGMTCLEGKTKSKLSIGPVTKVERYYCDVYDDYGHTYSVSYYVQVDNGIYAVPKDGISSFNVEKGESAELAVTAGSFSGNLQYKWYVLADYSTLIEGAASSTLKTGAINEYTEYTCVVSDGFGNQVSVYFDIQVDNSFEVWAGSQRILVEEGSDAKLEVYASSNSQLTYEWQKFNDDTEDWEVIAADGSDTCIIKFVYDYGWYRCIVSDKNGNSRTVEFDVYVIKSDAVTLELGKETAIIAYPETGYAQFTPKESGTYDFLPVTNMYSSSCDVYLKTENGFEEFHDWSGLPEAEYGFSFKLNLVKGETYYFALTTWSGGEGPASVSVLLTKHNDNGFYAKAKYDDTYNLINDNFRYEYDDYSKIVFGVDPNGSIVLQVEAHADAGKLHYNWWCGSDYYGNQEDVEWGSKYTIDGIYGHCWAECYIYDDYENYEYISFSVIVDSGLTAKAKTSDFQTINKNGSATMEVEASVDHGNIYYTWYYGNSDNPVAGGNGPSLTVTNVKEGRLYYCRVLDDYNGSEDIYFTIAVSGQNEGIPISKENFPDDVFRENIVRRYDGDKDGHLSKGEISRITGISIYNNAPMMGASILDKRVITSLKGIEFFTSLNGLDVEECAVERLDLSKNTALRYVYVYNNKLKELILGNNKNLYRLYCYNNDLAILDISGCPKLVAAYPNVAYKEDGFTIYAYRGEEFTSWLGVDNATIVISEKLTGWQKLGGTWYYFDSNSNIAKGWQKIDGKWYYFSDLGMMQRGWKKIDGKWYYFNSGGDMVTGWQKISNKWYYFNSGGDMVTGWQKISNKWYYFNSGGEMLTGWQKISNKWYYFNSGGDMVTGWQKISNKWYYFSSGGVMQTGWQEISGKTYYLKPSGVMAANEWCKGWWLNKDGTWTYQYKASWKQDSKGWYYQDTSGWYAKNTTLTIDDKSYTFDSKGYMK